MKTGIRIGLVLVVAVVGFWLWRVLFPGDEAVIRRQLSELAAAASFPVNEAPLAKVSNGARVAGFFAPTTDFDLTGWSHRQIKVGSREEIRDLAIGARNTVSSLSVRFSDAVFVAEPAGGKAIVRLTATVNGADLTGPESQVIELAMVKIDGDWLIERVASVEFIKR